MERQKIYEKVCNILDTSNGYYVTKDAREKLVKLIISGVDTKNWEEQVREYLEVYGCGAISVRGNHEQEDLILLIQNILENGGGGVPDEVEVVLTNDDDLYDEWWCAWYECPKCKEKEITDDFKYCPNCGVKLKLIRSDN